MRIGTIAASLLVVCAIRTSGGQSSSGDPAGDNLAPTAVIISQTIADQWTATHFPGQTDPGIIGMLANPDRDPLVNLLEFGFGGDPNEPAVTASGEELLPRTEPVEDGGSTFLEYTYRRRFDHVDAGLTYVPEVSTDLNPADWNPALIVAGSEDITPSADGITEFVTIRLAGTYPSVLGRLFTRMNVTLAACGGTGPPHTLGYLTDDGVHPPPATGTYAYNAFTPAAPGFPAVGGTYTDPVFGSTIKRLTEITGGNNEDIYAKHQANANGTLAFHRRDEVNVIELVNGAIVHSSQPVGIAAYEMHWDALDPDKYYYFSGKNLVRRNLAAQTNTVMKVFPSNLQVNGGSLNIQSRDGRYFTIRYGGTNKVWDSQSDTIYSGSVTPLSASGWVSITPDGNFIVTAEGSTPQPEKEHYSYPIHHDTTSIGSIPTQFWGLCGDHGTLVSASDGKNYFVTFECHDIGAVYRADITLDQAGRTPSQQRASNQILLPLTFNDDGHFSAVSRGPFADWVFLSTESAVDDFDSGVSGWTAYKQEIIAMNVVTLEVRRFAHHRSRDPLSNYYYQPRVSTSWDGSVVMWTSNYNAASPVGYSDLYMISLPLGCP